MERCGWRSGWRPWPRVWRSRDFARSDHRRGDTATRAQGVTSAASAPGQWRLGCGPAGWLLPRQKGLPLLLGAVEDVAVDVAVDAGRLAVGLILPELPGARPVPDRRMILGRAHPDRVVHEGAV